MSNRIDLTQFEGTPKRMEIEWNRHPIHGARYLIKVCEPWTPSVVGALVPDLTPWGHVAPSKPEQEKMAKLFAMSPELIAELKRCYRVIEDIESMIPDNHEEIDPVLSDILSECHRLLGM
jgi:hypothetical protein